MNEKPIQVPLERAQKLAYQAPTLEVFFLELEQGIAAGSTDSTYRVEDSEDMMQEQWMDLEEDNRSFSW